MKPEFKTPDQTEFSELFQKLEGAKWNRADVARALHVSGSAVTMILNGERNPRAATLAAMRGLASQIDTAREHGQQVEEKLESRDRVAEQLEYLREADPAGYRVATTTIEVLHQRAQEQKTPHAVILHEKQRPKPANSERVAQLAASSKAALVKIGVLPADAAGGKGSHSPPSEVDAPSDQTHPRPPASSGESKAPPHGHGGKGQR